MKGNLDKNKKTLFNDLTLGMLLFKMRTFIALITLILFFSFTIPNFLSVRNAFIITRHAAQYALLGIGMTFVILTGGIDLSVGSIVGLSAMIAGGLINEGLVLSMFGVTIYFNIFIVILITLAVGITLGAFNGFLVSRFNVPPFIATLGTLYIARGLALLRSGGETFSNLTGKEELGNTGFPFIGSGRILGLPNQIWILIIIAVIAIYITKKTPLGWHVYAVGGNEKAANISGIKVKNIKMFVYMFSGLMCAIVGLVVASELVAAHPATGDGWELKAIAATVLGGTSLSGGVGSVGGTIVGAFVIGILSDGLVMMGVSEFWQMVITGLVIITAVIFDQLQKKAEKKAAIQSNQ